MASYTVDPCPSCGGRHSFDLEEAGAERGDSALLFGGAASEPERSSAARVSCPVTGAWIDLPRLSAFAAGPREGSGEFEEWKAQSVAVGREFGRVMLTVSAAAIPALAATAKYLEVASAATLWQALFGVGLALVILAALGFAAALMPSLREVDRAGFEAHRVERLRQVESRLRLGLTLFGAGLGATAAALLGVLLS